MDKLRTLMTLVSAFSLFFTLSFALPQPVGAQASKNAVCEGVGLAGGNGCNTPAGSPTVENVVQLVVNLLSWIVGVVAVIAIIIGGLKYVTSGGDSASINSAKNTILYALVGLVVAVLAQVIVRFVLDQL